MQVWNVLKAANGNTGPNKSPKNRHLGTIAQLCRAISSQLRHASTIGKNLLSSNVSSTRSHNMLQSREWVDGSWAMGQMGHEIRMGHTGHGSLGVDPWPISFLTLWLDLYIVAMVIYRVSLWCMCDCACDSRSSKFTFTFKFMLVGLPRVPGYPPDTRVINFPGNFFYYTTTGTWVVNV